MFKGGFPSGGNLNNLLKQAQKMQEDMKTMQDELATKEFEVSTGGGAISLTMTGKKEVKSLKIKPEVVDPEDIEMLEDLITSAVNEAIRKVDETTSAQMSKFNIPGMF